MSASVGHHGNAFEKCGAAAPVVISIPDDESHVGANDKVKNAKKDALLTKYAKGLNYFRIAKYLFFLLAMVGIIVLSLQVFVLSAQVVKDRNTIQKLNDEMGTAPRLHDVALEGQLGGRMSYLEGFSGMTADDDDTVILAARDVMVSDDLSAATSTVLVTSVATAASTIASSVGETSSTGTCSSDVDTTVNVIRTTTAFLSSTSSTPAIEESTTTSDTSLTTVHTQMTTTVFTNTTGTSVLSSITSSLPTGTSLFSVDALSDSIDSPMATLPAVSTPTTTTSANPWTMSGLVPNNPFHCLEFGDGAGPCDRPYGWPNTPPSSVTLSIPEIPAPTSSYGPPSLVPIPFTSPSSPGGMTNSASSDTGAVSGTTTATSSTLSATDFNTVPATTSPTGSTISDADTTVCGPPTTVYVTLSPSMDTSTTEAGLTVASLSIDGGSDSTSSSPSTVTSTSTSLAKTITVTMASVTQTIRNSSATTTSGLITATGFTLTLSAHGNGTYSPTTTGPATVATLPPNSGGEKAVGKPMGAGGNGGTGNGMYCVVMLVSLLALLI